MNRGKSDKKHYIKKGERSVFDAADISLVCERGILWVTWPGSNDVILTENQMMHVRTDGKLCLTSFADSEVEITDLPLVNFFSYSLNKVLKTVNYYLHGNDSVNNNQFLEGYKNERIKIQKNRRLCRQFFIRQSRRLYISGK